MRRTWKAVASRPQSKAGFARSQNLWQVTWPGVASRVRASLRSYVGKSLMPPLRGLRTFMKIRKCETLFTLSAATLLCVSCSHGLTPVADSSSQAAAAPEVEVTHVVAQKLNTTVKLPAQLAAYENVDV